MVINTDIDSGYSKAIELANSHYENFPVISLLISKNLKKHVAIVYWFARTADDFADEENSEPTERMEKLDAFENSLKNLLTAEPKNEFEAALKKTITAKNLTILNFLNLLKAFKQDVIKKRYSTFDEVLDYCFCSANPIGRIMLELFEIRNDKAVYYSDKICTALQITNFLQDTVIDYQKGRIYYPEDEMERFEVTESMFEINKINGNLKQLIELNVNRIQAYFDEGKSLLAFLSGRFKYEIDWTIRGGEEILNKIRGVDFDVFSNRLVLTKSDHMKILIKVLFRL